jgi:hypothetical protein
VSGVLPPAKDLVSGLAQARAAGGTGPVKVCIRTRDMVNLQYVEGPGRTWVLYGKPQLLGRRWRRQFATLRALDKYVRQLSPEAVDLRPRTPRIVAVGKHSDSWRVELSEFADIAKAVGEDVFAAFMRCFVGADRLKSLLHFYIAADEKFGNIGPASERNFNVSWLLVVGTLHELGDALQALCSTQAHTKLKSQKTWLPLNKLRKTWYKAPLASRVRNQGGHHLGDTDVYKAGMAKLGEMTVDIPLRVGHGQQRHHSFARGAWDVLLLGMSSKTATRPEVEIAQLRRLLKDAGVAHRKLHDSLEAYFIAVLANAGIGITPGITP